MAENMEVDPAPPFGTFHLLKLVKDSQQMHGLRHNDYKRYSDYCNRRMRRLRKSLKFTHQHKCFPKHKAKFQPKKITPEIITDLRFIELLVYNIEHCWSRGMEFKFASEDEKHTRQKFHARTRLTRALLLARDLDNIAKSLSRIDNITKLEVQAYYSNISAAPYLEKKQWQKALEHYYQSKMIYEKLAKATKDSYLISLYDNRCKELASMIKVCEYNCGGNVSVAASDIMELTLNESSMDIEKLVSDSPSRSKKVPEQKVDKKIRKKKPKSKKKASLAKYFPTKPLFFDLALEQIAAGMRKKVQNIKV